jgi:hypothetical protein
VFRRVKRLLRRTVLVGLLFTGLVLAVDCSTPPPRTPNDICKIFTERRSWYHGANRSYQRWGVPVSLQLAVIHQESSFRSNARPPRSRFLWIFPGPRASTALGYGQALDPTWREYQKSTGNLGADRDDFADVADFIGWYGDRAESRAAVPKTDPYRFYLAYHEGPGGYRSGTWKSKPWLQQVARKVSARANRYHQQYLACHEELASYRWWWPL